MGFAGLLHRLHIYMFQYPPLLKTMAPHLPPHFWDPLNCHVHLVAYLGRGGAAPEYRPNFKADNFLLEFSQTADRLDHWNPGHNRSSVGHTWTRWTPSEAGGRLGNDNYPVSSLNGLRVRPTNQGEMG